jgi:acyl-CoA thioesterase I
MVRCLTLLLFAALSAGAGSPPGEPTLLVLGDSISAGFGIGVEEGWVALLQGRLQREGYGYRVVNASVSGETTGGGLSRLPRALQLHQPKIVIIELGGNDGLMGLPLDVIRKNLKTMIQASRSSGALVLLVGMRLPSNYGPKYVDGFHAIYPNLAKRYASPLVPFLMEGVALDRRLMQWDGIHPTAAAQSRLLDNVWPVLKPLLGVPRKAGAKSRTMTPTMAVATAPEEVTGG